MPETIAIFGGTGQTGTHAVAYALEKGYKVQILVRNASKVTTKNENLTVIEGDITDQAALEKTIKGATYVVSFVGGPTKPSEYPKDMMLNYVKLLWPLLEAESSVKVFLYQAGGLSAVPGKPLSFVTKIIRFIAAWAMGIGPMIADNEQAAAWMHENKKDSFAVIVTLPGALKESDSGEVVEVTNDAPLPFGPITFKALAIATVNAVTKESLYGTFPYVVPTK
jgi:nucleoside-diphosphate-sugar epimerase